MRIKRRYIIIIAILMFLVLLDRMLVYRTRKLEKRMQTFVSKLIDSIDDGTDFRKKYLADVTASRIKPYISKNYEIFLIDCDFGLWEYSIVFDKKYRLYLSFAEENGNYNISIGWPKRIDDNKE